jgi:predicted nuclease with RNAse H fold
MIYTKKISDPDYFYRLADRETKAMSPMFLGGLTARAIKLRDEYLGKKIEFLETYPKKVSEILMEAYHLKYKEKENMTGYLTKLEETCGFPFADEPTNWHEADAVLAWLGGKRYLNGTAIQSGNPAEGTIIF